MEHVPEEVQLWQNLEISQPFLNKHFSFERQKRIFKDNSFSGDFTKVNFSHMDWDAKMPFLLFPPSGGACAGANNAKRERYS